MGGAKLMKFGLNANDRIAVRTLNKIFFFVGVGVVFIHFLTVVRIIEDGLGDSVTTHEGMIDSSGGSVPGVYSVKSSPSSVLRVKTVQSIVEDRTQYEKKLPHFKKKSDDLEFVHITKTAGSAIEKAAAKVGIHWGLCHFETNVDMGPACERPDWMFRKKTGQLRTKRQLIQRGIGEIELWHTPPSFFYQNPYQNSDTFTVVRNPYERIISEFYCPYFGLNSKIRLQPNSDMEDETESLYRINEKNSVQQTSQHYRNRSTAVVTMLNSTANKQRFIEGVDDLPKTKKSLMKREKLPETAKALNDWILKNIERRSKQHMSGKVTFMSAHMLPQHYYIFDDDGNYTIDHVLKYETLHRDFPILMEVYGQPVLLPTKKELSNRTVGERKRLRVDDLLPKVIDAINIFFKEDFIKLGYEMISNQT